VAPRLPNASSVDHYILSHNACGNGEDAVHTCFSWRDEMIMHRSGPLTRMFYAHISLKCCACVVVFRFLSVNLFFCLTKIWEMFYSYLPDVKMSWQFDVCIGYIS
jgi:hypothetical protein